MSITITICIVSVVISKMNNVRMHWGALKFKNEKLGMYCANSKINLEVLVYGAQIIRNNESTIYIYIYMHG